MTSSAPASTRYVPNFRSPGNKNGLANRPPETWHRSWRLQQTGPFDFSPASDQRTTISQNLDDEEPWTPPANAHPEINLLEFVRGAWRILEPAVPFIDGWHIDLLCDHLQALSTNRLLERNLLINEPPGSSKSLVTAVFWPAWEWTWAPWTRWLTSSYDDALALRDAVRTRRLMQSDWYRKQVSEPWALTGDQNTKGYYSNDRTGWRIATSVNGANTGTHASRVVIDDPHAVNRVESDVQRESVLTALREVYPSRVLPGGCRVIIGQRVHEEDASADWLDREGESVHHIEIKEEYERPTAAHPERICTMTGRGHDPRTVEGELLTPERFPSEVIEHRKIELGPYAFASQFQQTPTPRAGMLLDPAEFVQTPLLEASTVDLVCSLDLNYSDSETSDWTVGILGAVDRGGVFSKIHIIDVLREHLSDQRHEQVLGDWLCLWRPILVGIEKRAFEREGATMDLCRRLMLYCEERGFALSVEPVTVDTDKISRAMIIPGRSKHGLITVDRRAKWWPALSRELTTFGRSGADDQVDALSQLVRLVVEKLERVRGHKALYGHSSAITYSEAQDPDTTDLGRLTAAGWR